MYALSSVGPYNRRRLLFFPVRFLSCRTPLISHDPVVEVTTTLPPGRTTRAI
jgi:hypothetical protein